MEKTLALLVTCCLLLSATALKLPDFVKKCSLKDPEFNACALKNAREALPHIVNGLKKFQIPVLDPLIVEEIRAVDGQIDMAGLNVRVEGIRNAILESIRSHPAREFCEAGWHRHTDRSNTLSVHSFDFDQKKIAAEVVVPEAHFSGRYEVKGKLLTLPLSGNGPFNSTFYHLYVKYVTTFDLTKHDDGHVYLEPKEYKVHFQPKNVKAHLGNLFNGNTVLGDIMNQFINENWREVLQELGQPTYDALGLVVHKILNNTMRVVPYKDLFDDTD
ncbi:hypothetical protein B7P43_G07896 [Cryptotermes secundus]|uniref:Protein takeout n=1 Tax=Cryptotermes secundus TaxID=105785 RepID=A0A2J7QTH7_9NEOP|nr:hypothetical protein B7P43_G07896 [Cryptotermes secundus]